MFEIQFDPGKVMEDIKEFSGMFGVSVADIINDNQRLMTIGVMQGAPPLKNGRMSGARAFGRQAVESDILQVVAGMETWSADEPSGGDMILHRENGTRNTGPAWLVQRNMYRPGASQLAIRRHHVSMRNRKGRVKRMRNYSARGMTVVPKMHVREQALKQYIKSEQAKVGRLKGGFMPAIEHWSRVSNSPIVRGVPKWVRTQSRGEGSARGRLSRNGTGNVYSVVSVPYATIAVRKSVVNFEQRKRERFIKHHMFAMAKNLVKRFNA